MGGFQGTTDNFYQLKIFYTKVTGPAFVVSLAVLTNIECVTYVRSKSSYGLDRTFGEALGEGEGE